MEEERTPEQLVAGLVKLLEVKDQGDDQFIGRKKRGGIGRVFGGQVIAQALHAAEMTVDPSRPAHSLHAYFLRGGSEGVEVDYRVERDFDGGSFSNRRVVASQQGRPILNLTASFQKGGKTGPNLYGVIGRAAGTYPEFKYGESIVALGASGFAWTEADIVEYVADPAKFLKARLGDDKAKSKMSFKLNNETDAANVAAFLATFSAAPAAATE